MTKIWSKGSTYLSSSDNTRCHEVQELTDLPVPEYNNNLRTQRQIELA